MSGLYGSGDIAMGSMEDEKDCDKSGSFHSIQRSQLQNAAESDKWQAQMPTPP